MECRRAAPGRAHGRILDVTQAVLPRMRQRRAGHIFFITSMGGVRTFPGLSASNHACDERLRRIADRANAA